MKFFVLLFIFASSHAFGQAQENLLLKLPKIEVKEYALGSCLRMPERSTVESKRRRTSSGYDEIYANISYVEIATIKVISVDPQSGQLSSLEFEQSKNLSKRFLILENLGDESYISERVDDFYSLNAAHICKDKKGDLK